jgi:hypothetical protein
MRTDRGAWLIKSRPVVGSWTLASPQPSPSLGRSGDATIGKTLAAQVRAAQPRPKDCSAGDPSIESPLQGLSRGMRVQEVASTTAAPMGSSAIRVLELSPRIVAPVRRSDVRTSEVLSRSVSRHDAESEPGYWTCRTLRRGLPLPIVVAISVPRTYGVSSRGAPTVRQRASCARRGTSAVRRALARAPGG